MGSAGATSAEETQVAIYNQWVRSGTVNTGADGYFDFDSAIDAGGALKPIYDSGDHLHPNSAGAAALANVIAVGLL